VKNLSVVLIILLSSFNAFADFRAEYFLDSQSVKGGLKEGLATQGQLLLSLYQEQKKTHYHLSALVTHGETTSKFVGDKQATSNIDIAGEEVIKLFEAYILHRYQKTELLFGLYDLSAEFNVNEPALFFF
jgi:hypothetical protein